MTTVNISYQATVSIGLETGSYASSAVCRSMSSGEDMSNESVVSVKVIPDTLFCNATLIDVCLLMRTQWKV